ncbi:MAG TPA: hypothetical protein PLE19_12060 [Planctomycetota bacterium]|nr:hypothetical protein [Planctomycetota bacterium]HRR82088.1 hypothetical protein [Planctomycetota bacterium]HRT96451.1 hypothetical protein [Planctomycetota bacterium]
MKKLNWRVKLGVALVLLSVVLYTIHWLFFRDLHHILIYLVGDIAFLPLDVLIVTLILHAVLNAHEKRSLLQKMNMVIGAFFSEVGTKLLKDLSAFDAESGRVVCGLVITPEWSNDDFRKARAQFRSYDFKMDCGRGDLEALKAFLTRERTFLLGLLQNPNLLEHGTFTDLLWAVTHLAEELSCRHDAAHLAETDAAHIAGDMRRAYGLLIAEWLDYMRHLKGSYPYLFSLALRTNPFDANACAEVG